MTDRRLTLATSRVAHDRLRGVVTVPAYAAGQPMQVAVPLADLLDRPGGARDRQVLLGEGFLVIDRDQRHAFGRADKDGYCGWLPDAALEPQTEATHRLIAPASHLYPEPRVQSRETATLSFGARLRVLGTEGKFSRTPQGHVPTAHLGPIDLADPDPVAVAALFLGTPYLWGGNSRAGIDCSGLVQAALLACGIPCPGDSDLQQAVGTAIPDKETLAPGDLLFWKGHVAMVADAERLIHANGHAMACTYERISDTITRIAAQGGGPVVARRRPR